MMNRFAGSVLSAVLLCAAFSLVALERELFSAIRADDLPKAEKLISAKTLEERNTSGGSLLHIAAGEGASRIFRYLVEKKSMNWQEKDRYGTTPFLKAAEADSVEIVRYLTERGADPLEKDRFGACALHRAAGANALKVMKYLLDERKLAPGITDNSGSTALHKAAEGNALEVLKYLIEEKKLDVHVRSGAGDSILRSAVRNGKLPAAQYLIEKAGMDAAEKNARGENLLFAAVSYPSNPAELVRYLADGRKLGVGGVGAAGESLLRRTAEFGSVAILRFLLDEKRMNVKETASDGSTLLHAAAAHSRLDILKYLVEEKKLDPSVRNKNGKTPADAAGESGVAGAGSDPEKVRQYLLKASAAPAPVSPPPAAAPAEKAAKKTEQNIPDPEITFPVYGKTLPLILPCDRGHGMFALVKNYQEECHVSIRNPGKKMIRIQVIPIADSWFTTAFPMTSIRLNPGKTAKFRLSFGQSASCTGVRVYWRADGMDAPKCKDFFFKDAGPVPRTGKVIEYLAWKTGKGPLKKTTPESLEDGAKLYDAFKKRKKFVFSNLLKAGADPNARFLDEQLNLNSVFRMICMSAREMPDYKAYLDLMMRSADIESVLFWDSQFPSSDADAPVLKYLLQHDVNPNGRGPGTYVLLDSLLTNPFNCTEKMYALIFQSGADPNRPVWAEMKGKGGTSSHWYKKPTATIIRLAEAWLPAPKDETQNDKQAAEFLRILKLFLKKGAKPNTMREASANSKGPRNAKENILHFLAKRSMTPAGLEAFKLLLDAGADPNAADSPAGNTPLLYLAEEDTVWARNAVRLLIKAGANLKVQNAKKQTPVDIATGKMKVLLQHAHEKSRLELERPPKP